LQLLQQRGSRRGFRFLLASAFGSRFAELRDPEGNGIQLWEPMDPA